MMDKLRTLIWYAFLLTLFLVIWHFGSSFSIAIVDEGFHYMEPTLEPNSTRILDRRPASIVSLSRDDLIAYEALEGGRVSRLFARVLATPGTTVSIREKRILVDGNDVANAQDSLVPLGTGLIVPRDCVFIGFDSPNAPGPPVAKRLIFFRNIIGRVTGK